MAGHVLSRKKEEEQRSNYPGKQLSIELLYKLKICLYIATNKAKQGINRLLGIEG
jgi:hypothetical protein